MKQTLSYFIVRPKYWFGLIGFAISWLIARLPRAMQRGIARALGFVMLKVSGRHKKIVDRNLTLCFPEKTAEERETIIKENAYLTGYGVVETSACWFSDLSSYLKDTKVHGIDNLHAALDKGKGVILLSFHTTGLEIGAQLLSHQERISGMYKPDKNPLIEYMMTKGRLRHVNQLVQQQDVRSMLKVLKNNGIVWYAADQDYGPKRSAVFAPFFGIPAACITATTKFAKMTGAAVIPFTQTRTNKARNYELTVYPALKNFPGESELADATRINQILEDILRANPADYFWVHKRFKTRPNNEESLY
ncbi:LpxL/LpxP family Kdo(2)-lipid IV(A) lauroyl/palmitoleoyl acyltransferase [Aliikangiella marina]|uniref:Lipid A biosynthesis acyltransferase n=1 Tax=Aliikangiella marina TaxID=1712262 RepID=A0A545TJX1_9GAMM|nr:LpxL/LpxP family Kdo(2)-lipid IV(A) lauroyl/palmitoleoyl acyltransferase [Aliikangiella marina]TQV77461.1 LpxL/LpxP family Kdo(2)-lipid IV(A) lauroyl/palmitoleoyl acyltransferase [Aliikangiella marina]